MAEIDAQDLADQAVLLGLITREQSREALASADDGSLEALRRSLTRKGFLTSWQVDKLTKGADPTGYFYGGCKVLFHIAEGSFARVYRGVKEPGNQSVAIKVLRRRYTSDPESIQRFNHEAEAGMKLIHPSIVRVYDYGEQDQNHYMIMEYVEGSNLRDFLKLRHRVPHDQAIPLIMSLAEALKYSLSQGITHRDLKATNVLISHRGQAKLVDFGLATIEGDASEEKKMQKMRGVRTVDYATLERTCGSPKGDPRSDIFFLGCVYYQLLTGQPPLPESEESDPLKKQLKRSLHAIRPLSEQGSAPPPGLCAIVEKMMKIDLKSRYQTMDEVLADLKSYQASLSLPPPPAPVAPRRPVAAPHEEDAFVPGGFETAAYHQKEVYCVEVQEPIQNAFRKSLSELGFKVILVRDPERAVERYEESPPDLLIFDADGLPKSEAIHALQRIQERCRADHREFTALVILGPRQESIREHLPESGRVIVLTKPLRMKQVQEALSRLVPSG